MAALAAGTLALQRQIKAMTATHAAEVKDLRDSHAAELADVKGRAVTRIKELQGEVRIITCLVWSYVRSSFLSGLCVGCVSLVFHFTPGMPQPGIMQEGQGASRLVLL